MVRVDSDSQPSSRGTGEEVILRREAKILGAAVDEARRDLAEAQVRAGLHCQQPVRSGGGTTRTQDRIAEADRLSIESASAAYLGSKQKLSDVMRGTGVPLRPWDVPSSSITLPTSSSTRDRCFSKPECGGVCSVV